MHTGKLKTYTGHCTKLGENWREKRMGQWQWMMAAPWFSDGDDASLVMLCWANRWKPRRKMLVMFHYAFLPVALEGLMFLALTAEGESFLRNTFGETHQSIQWGQYEGWLSTLIDSVLAVNKGMSIVIVSIFTSSRGIQGDLGPQKTWCFNHKTWWFAHENMEQNKPAVFIWGLRYVSSYASWSSFWSVRSTTPWRALTIAAWSMFGWSRVYVQLYAYRNTHRCTHMFACNTYNSL